MVDHLSAVQQAVVSARLGDKGPARHILEDVLEREPLNPAAWYIYAQLVEIPEEAIFCLERVLALKPDHQRARHRLERLRATLPGARPAHRLHWNGWQRLFLFLLVTATLAVLGLGAYLSQRSVALEHNLAALPVEMPAWQMPGLPLAAGGSSASQPAIPAAPCTCTGARAYLERTHQRLAGMQMDLRQLRSDPELSRADLVALSLRSRDRFLDQRAETPQPCLQPFHNQVMSVFVHWQQAMQAIVTANYSAAQASLGSLSAQWDKVLRAAGDLQGELAPCRAARKPLG